MSDPRRLRDKPSVPTEILLRGARRPQPPAAHELERLGAAVDLIARGPTGAPVSWLRLGVAAVFAFAIVGGGTFVWALHQRNAERAAAEAARGEFQRSPTPAAVSKPLPAAEVKRTPPAPARPSRRHVAETRVAAAPMPPPAEAPKPNDSLAREVPLIDAGRAELATAPSRALALLETHRREFPHGQLAAEREFLAVQALLQMNHMAEAKKRATELENHYPTSSYAARAVRLIEDAEAQRAAVPSKDGSRGNVRPGLQRNQDRL